MGGPGGADTPQAPTTAAELRAQLSALRTAARAELEALRAQNAAQLAALRDWDAQLERAQSSAASEETAGHKAVHARRAATTTASGAAKPSMHFLPPL